MLLLFSGVIFITGISWVSFPRPWRSRPIVSCHFFSRISSFNVPEGVKLVKIHKWQLSFHWFSIIHMNSDQLVANDSLNSSPLLPKVRPGCGKGSLLADQPTQGGWGSGTAPRSRARAGPVDLPGWRPGHTPIAPLRRM